MSRSYVVYLPEWHVLNIFSTADATVVCFGYMLVACYLLYSLKYGPIASANPWKRLRARVAHLFATPDRELRRDTIVTREAYDHSYLDQDPWCSSNG
jgi:cytochrome c oxidase subunit 1